MSGVRTILRLAAAAFVAALTFVVWAAWPIYGFYAHNGAVPFGPLGWVSAPAGAAPTVSEAIDPTFESAGEKALAGLARHREAIGAPALSAAVAVDGALVWRGAVGWADLGAGRPATPATIFRIGSASKALTASALARLVDRDVIDLDAPLTTYFDALPNPDWAAMTPRQLASHMAGLPHCKRNTDRHGLYQTAALRRHYPDVRDALEVFDESDLLFAPGEDFHYSTLGTVLLGAAISEAAGASYREIMREEVFEPAGMTETTPAPMRARDENFATFYYQDGARYREWRPVDLSHRLPGGGWASTPSDLARLGAAQLSDAYISSDTRAAFWTPQRLAHGAVNEQRYAIGWRWREWDVDGVGRARNANHGGVSRGSQAWLLVFPDFNMAIAIATNTKTEAFFTFGEAYEHVLRAFAPAARDAGR